MRPWYLDHVKTCAVLNRIANRAADTEEVRRLMDRFTQMLWAKLEGYYSATV